LWSAEHVAPARGIKRDLGELLVSAAVPAGLAAKLKAEPASEVKEARHQHPS
jgi:hypothetical protein